LVVWWLSCLPLDPRFMVSNPAKDDGFLRVIKIHSPTSYRGEVKLLAPCRKFLWHVKEPCEVWKRYFISNIHGHLLLKFLLLSYQVSLLVIARELWWVNQEWLELRLGTHNRSVMVAVLGTHCAIPPRNSKNNSIPLKQNRVVAATQTSHSISFSGKLLISTTFGLKIALAVSCVTELMW
jgi:hypothetical protein